MLLSLVLILSSFQAGASTPKDEILGAWHYTGFIYDGHRYPKPNANLVVRFNFFTSGTARLYWNRADESGYCERLSEYSVEEDRLKQKVTWLNPDNDASCASDPDMQLGRETENKVSIEGVELHLYMQLNGRDFIYALERDDR